MDHGTNGFALVHQVKRSVDILQPHGMSDECIKLEFSLEIALDITRQFRAALDSTEGGAAPDTPGDELEWPRRDLRACRGATAERLRACSRRADVS